VSINIISGANNALQLKGANHLYVIEAVLEHISLSNAEAAGSS
jgi:hypothetical protein